MSAKPASPKPPLHPSTGATGSAAPSPCVNVCRMDPVTAWCEGCLRTIEEISAWSRLADADKWIVLRQLPGRRARRLTQTGPSPGATPSKSPD